MKLTVRLYGPFLTETFKTSRVVPTIHPDVPPLDLPDSNPSGFAAPVPRPRREHACMSPPPQKKKFLSSTDDDDDDKFTEFWKDTRSHEPAFLCRGARIRKWHNHSFLSTPC